MIHPVEGSLAFQPYGQKGQSINSVSRAALNQALLDAAERSGNVRVRFGRRCAELDLEAGAIVSVDAVSGLEPERHAGVILGADGAYSAVRGQLQRRERYDFSQDYLSHGYKELSIPPAPGGAHQLDPNALHIWPRGGYMMMAMANVDGSFTVTLYLGFDGPDSFSELVTADAVERFFEREFPDAVPLLPGLAEAFLKNPTGSLVTIRCRPWHIGGAVALLGDACHAIVPFFGQGANAAFEDCLALDAALAQESGRRGARLPRVRGRAPPQRRCHRRSGAHQLSRNAGPGGVAAVPVREAGPGPAAPAVPPLVHPALHHDLLHPDSLRRGARPRPLAGAGGSGRSCAGGPGGGDGAVAADSAERAAPLRSPLPAHQFRCPSWH